MVWRPPKNQPVSDKECIGRRLFGNDNFVKQTSGKGKTGAVKLDVFLEERNGADLSVDRLGLNQVNYEVSVELLNGDCKEHQISNGKDFSGWAIIKQASFIRVNPHNLDVIATPTSKNIYHADVKTAHLEKQIRNSKAFCMAALAEYYFPENTNKNISTGFKELFSKFTKLLSQLIKP